MDQQEQPKTDENNQIVDVAPAPAAEAEVTSETTTDSSAEASTPNVESNADKPELTKESPVDGQLPAPGLPTGHKAGGPIIAIVAAIVVALGLAAVTVYAYMKMQDEKQPSSSQTETNNSDAETPASEDVDNATKDVDDAINATDQTEFDETELSDESLGL